jgi:predicted metal-dependent enzyme (double-stranded beta helix superfamily)
MEDNKNGKANIREVRDLFDKFDDEKISPMRVDIAQIKTLLTEHLKRYDAFCEQNTKEHKEIHNQLLSKISIKSFSAWLTGVSIFLGIVLIILKFFGIM